MSQLDAVGYTMRRRSAESVCRTTADLKKVKRMMKTQPVACSMRLVSFFSIPKLGPLRLTPLRRSAHISHPDGMLGSCRRIDRRVSYQRHCILLQVGRAVRNIMRPPVICPEIATNPRTVCAYSIPNAPVIVQTSFVARETRSLSCKRCRRRGLLLNGKE